MLKNEWEEVKTHEVPPLFHVLISVNTNINGNNDHDL